MRLSNGLAEHPARDRALELVRRYGWNATAFQTLEEGYRYFFHADRAFEGSPKSFE